MYTLLSVGGAGRYGLQLQGREGGREGQLIPPSAGLAWFKAVPSNEIDKK